MPADAYINPLTGDLPDSNRFIEGFELSLQKLRIRLGTFFGEWLLDTSVGLPYHEWSQQKPADLQAVAAIVLVEIIGGTDSGIKRVDNFTAEFEVRDGVNAGYVFAGNVIFAAERDGAVSLRAEVLAAAGNTTPAMLFFGDIGPIAIGAGGIA
jgi:hypothetical protein